MCIVRVCIVYRDAYCCAHYTHFGVPDGQIELLLLTSVGARVGVRETMSPLVV